MVGDEPTLCAVLKTLKSFYSTPESMPPLIVDPVMVAASGHSLLDRSANALIRNELVPLATLVTPNVLETELLLGLEAGSVRSLGDMVRAAEHVGALGPRGVLVKGAYCKFTAQDVLNYSVSDRVQVHWDVGCGPDQSAILRLGNTQPIEEQAVVVDALWLRDPGTTPPITLFVRPRLETTNTHGTGCTLSAALACAFAQGLSREFIIWLIDAGLMILNSIGCNDPSNTLYTPSNRDCTPDWQGSWATQSYTFDRNTNRSTARPSCLYF